MINMASVGKPKKGGIFNALNPVNSSVPVMTRLEEEKYLMSLPLEERKALLANLRITN